MPPPSVADVEQLALQLSPQDRRLLVERISRNLERPPQHEKTYVDLYGIYKGLVPDDFDVTEALRQIRSEWHDELEGLGDPK